MSGIYWPLEQRPPSKVERSSRPRRRLESKRSPLVRPRQPAGAIAPSVMVRPALEVADILREHGPAWRETSIYR